MIKRLIIFQFLLCSAFSFSQTNVYYPFPDSNAVWTQTYGGTFLETCGPDPHFNVILYEDAYSYKLKGDTLISGNLYHKIYMTGTHHKYCFQGTNPNEWTTYINVYSGAYRQNIGLKKVLFIAPSSTLETVLYDFVATVGSTLVNQCQVTVTSIDSVLIGTNYRKRFNLSSDHKIIEGIGSSTGLLENICPVFEWSGVLTCFKQNNKTIYPDTIFQCQTMTSLKESNEKIAYTISPNPSSGIYHITGLNNEYVIEVFDLTGKSIYKKNTADNSATIDLSQNKTGIYYFRLIDSNGNNGYGKLSLIGL